MAMATATAMAMARVAAAGTNDEAASGREGREAPPEPAMEFESYFDRESGSWSLRKIPSSPPASGPVEPGDGDATT